MTLFPTIYTRLVALLVTFVTIIALGIGAIYFEGTEKLLVENAVSDLENEAFLFEADLDAVIGQLKSDVQLLRNMPPAYGIVRARENGGIDPVDRSTEEQWMQRYRHIFEETIQERPYYTNIRLIGVANEGMELLRVMRTGENVVVIPQQSLVSKEDRSYFYPTIGLPEGGIYLSQIDLNREGPDAEIQRPFSLVIRAAMPILDDQGNPVAMVMINANFSRMLRDVASQVASQRILNVATQTGSYLFHRDHGKLYADDLGHGHRIQHDYPQILGMEQQAENYLTLVETSENSDEIRSYHRYYYDGPESENYLYYLLSANYDDFVGGLTGVQIQGAYASVGFLVLSGTIALLILHLLLNPYRQISSGLARYQAGEKDLKLPTWATTEAGALARKFESMITVKEQDDWIRDNLVNSSREMLAFDDFKKFGNGLMNLLCPLSGAHIGVIYLRNQITNDSPQGEYQSFLPLGSYGIEQPLDEIEAVHEGSGLIGQSVRDGKIRLLVDVPEDYFRVTTSLSSSKPRVILMLPVLYEHQTIAILELASVSEFSPLIQTFLERFSFDLGMIINNLAAAEQVRMLLEKANKTTSELKISNQQLDEFAYIASHDLKEPLRGIANYGRFLLEDYGETLDEEGCEMLERISFLSQRMEGLINDLLYYSRLSNQKLAIQETDIPSVIEDIREMLNVTLDEHNVTLMVEDDIPVITCDKPRVTEVFRNLISNAVKYNHNHEKLVEVGYLASAQMDEKGFRDVFFVRDNGIGVKKEFHEDLFKMFKRLNEEEDSVKGTGVGLAFVKKIIERHGGRIWLDSSPGKGTTFFFTLKPEES
jgi:signal transduction histidine kinase